MSAQWASLPYGSNRLAATLEAGDQIVKTWGTSQLMRKMAADIVQQFRASSDKEEARAIQIWVHNRVKYRRDPADAEMIQDPLKTLERGGDCDDQAILAASLLRAIGHDARIATVQWMGRRDPSHAVAVDLTSKSIVDPVSEEWPEQWPPAGYKVQEIKYRNNSGQMVALDGLFGNVFKALAKPFTKVFKPHTLLGKIMDPLGANSRNLKTATKVADVVGTAVATFYTMGAYGALAAGGSIGGFGATVAAGAGMAGSGALAAGKFLLANLGKTAGTALIAQALGKSQAGEQLSPQEQAAVNQYQANPSYYDSGAAYGGGGGGGGYAGGGFDQIPGMGTTATPGTFPMVPVALGLGLLAIILISRSKK